MAMNMVAQQGDTDLAALVAQAIKGMCPGIAPHGDGQLQEEYRAVPIHLRHKKGLTGDVLASNLAEQRPELGIESEDQLYQILSEGTRQRRDAPKTIKAPAKGNGKPVVVVSSTSTSTFDPIKARGAVQDFAEIVEGLDSTVVDQLRDAWKRAYTAAGHKALARYLVTQDLAIACRSFDKLAVN